MKKILLSPAPSRALRLFHQTGLLQVILPELADCVGVGQKGRHVLDVFDHSIAACDAAPGENLCVRAAALFHDIAKPKVKDTGEDGEVTFHRHEVVGAEICETILSRFKASNAEKNCIIRLVRHHMFHYTSEWTDAAIRRFITRAGLDILDDLIALRLADASAIAPGAPAPISHLKELIERIDTILEAETALSIRDLEVGGRDLIRELNIKPGPVMGSLLEHLLDCVLEDPEVNNREKLLEMARRWLEVYTSDST